MKEIKIQVPDGFEGIDVDKSDFSNGIIVFKPISHKAWRHQNHEMNGYLIDVMSEIRTIKCIDSELECNYNVFATKKHAKVALAIAQISQIMTNDERFGGPITDEEWNNLQIKKYIIFRRGDKVDTDWCESLYHFLAFHTREQRELFMQENMDLIRQYYMLDD